LAVLAICCMSLLIVGLDNTIVNVALPSIQHDLHASVSGLQWTIDAYTLVLASLLMLSGSTGDRLGRRRVFQTGLTLFTLGSLLCGIAPSLSWLVTFRVLQAVGGSMLNPVALSIVTNTFTDPKERARAIGVWGSVFGVSLALGPIVGGTLVGSVGWRAIFWINVPIGVAALLLAAFFVPESKAARPRRVDPVGQVLVIVLLASLTYAIIQGPEAGWGSAEIISCFALAAVTAAVLPGYERRRAEPLVDPRFFGSAPFSGATLIAICAFGALSGLLFLSMVYLQDVRDYSALRAGLCVLPLAAMAMLLPTVSARILNSRGPRIPLAIGGIGIAVAGLLLTRLSTGGTLTWLLLAFLIFGIGHGMVNPPITNTAVSGMPSSQAGVAAAVASTSRQVGNSLGVAIIGSVVTSNVHGPLRTGFASASHLAWWIVVGCGLVILATSIITTSGWARRTAARTAAHFTPEPPRIPVTTP
jgi:EmrB/QacA subfamily drug resistance transporter